MKLFQTTLVCATILSTTAQAEGIFTLGAFASNDDGVYVDHNDWSVLPYVDYEINRFQIELDGLSYSFVDTDQTTLSIGATTNYGDIFDQSIPLFDGLHREADLQIGLAASHDFGAFFVEGEVAADVSDAGSGHSATAAVGYATDLSIASLSLKGGVTYTSDDHNQYHYGVALDEVTANRDAFLTDDAFLPFIAVELLVPVADNVAIVAQIEFTDFSALKTALC